MENYSVADQVAGAKDQISFDDEQCQHLKSYTRRLKDDWERKERILDKEQNLKKNAEDDLEVSQSREIALEKEMKEMKEEKERWKDIAAAERLMHEAVSGRSPSETEELAQLKQQHARVKQ